MEKNIKILIGFSFVMILSYLVYLGIQGNQNQKDIGNVSDCIVNWAKTFIAIAGLAILFAVFNHLGGEFPDTILGCFFLLMLEVSGIAMLGGLGFVLLYLLGIIEVGCSRQNGFKILSILAPVLVLSALIVFYYLRTILDLSQLIENNQ